MIALPQPRYQRNVLHETLNPFLAFLARRDFDLSKKRGCRTPKMSQKWQVFDYFSATTARNHSRFSALATLHSILTEIRQVKPSRFQTRSLKKISDCTFYLIRAM